MDASNRAHVGVASTCAVAFVVSVLAGSAQAGVTEERAQRSRCAQLWADAPSVSQEFEVPRAYTPVSEPGGPLGITIVKRGRRWHPARTDVQRLGARIETQPTDNFYAELATSMHQLNVQDGTIYSRSECDGLSCLFKVAFVPQGQTRLAAECGVWPMSVRIDGETGQGLEAAREAIRFGGAQQARVRWQRFCADAPAGRPRAAENSSPRPHAGCGLASDMCPFSGFAVARVRWDEPFNHEPARGNRLGLREGGLTS
jgi:hypothetical protein